MDNRKFLITWSEISVVSDRIKQLSDEERTAAKQATKTGYRYLTNVVFEKTKRHPLVQYFLNEAPWTRRWLIWFATQLECFSVCEGFEGLIKRLQMSDKFWESLYTLEIAERFNKTGGTIKFEQEPEKGRSKQADLQLRIGNDLIYIEMTTCGPSEQEQRAMNSFQGITFGVLLGRFSGQNYAGKLYRKLSDQHLAEVKKYIETALESLECKGFVVVEKPDVIQLAVCTNEKSNLLAEWASKHGLEPGTFTGPGWEENELSRVRVRLKQKSKRGQIPSDKPGIIVIRSSRALGPQTDILKLTAELEEEIHSYSNIIATVLIGGYGGTGREFSRKISQSFLTTRKISDLRLEYALFVPNKYTLIDVSKETLKAIKNVFTKV